MAVLSLLAALAPGAVEGGGSPRLQQDPQANIADVFAFIGTRHDDAARRVLNVIVHVGRFAAPADGGIYARFADDALYSIHITRPTTGQTVLRYDFRFSAVDAGYKNPDTILSYGLGTEVGAIRTTGDARQNYSQTYSVTRVGGGVSTVMAIGVPTPPPNLGARTTPFYNDPSGRAVSGAATRNELDPYTAGALKTLSTGEAVFAGTREDGFYADIAGLFDLLDPRLLGTGGVGQDGGGIDALKGFNVLAYAIQIPVDSLPAFEYSAVFGDLGRPLPATSGATGVGVYASVSRHRVTARGGASGPGGDPGLLSADCNGDGELDVSDAVCLLRYLFLGGDAPPRVGADDSWVQVSRMGNPLFNDLFVPLADKDRYDRSAPTGDAHPTAGFAAHARDPELAALISAVYGLPVVGSGRTDLAAMYIPDVLRVETTTPPVKLAGQAGFSRFGFLGGDTTTSGAGRIVSSGWPNGRRPADDVVDILLTTLMSGPAYAAVNVLGDNVAANDQIYHQVFPYSATPHSGTANARN